MTRAALLEHSWQIEINKVCAAEIAESIKVLCMGLLSVCRLKQGGVSVSKGSWEQIQRKIWFGDAARWHTDKPEGTLEAAAFTYVRQQMGEPTK